MVIGGGSYSARPLFDLRGPPLSPARPLLSITYCIVQFYIAIAAS